MTFSTSGPEAEGVSIHTDSTTIPPVRDSAGMEAPERSTRATLHIGEVATLTDLSIPTIRHWEQVGLVTPTGRSAGGFRLYSAEDVARIRLLRFMKPLNFTLEQMRELLEIREALAMGSAVEDRASALVWPRTSPLGADSRRQLARELERYAERAEHRLEKLRTQVTEVEEFITRLRDEARAGGEEL